MHESKTPRFSVLIPAFNAEATLARTVESVLAQSFADWELVIVDDGSTDDTLATARRLAEADDRIRVLTQENRGTGGAYNTAVGGARADLLVMLSADDLLLPEHLERFDEFIEADPGAGVYSCSGYLDYPDGRRVEQGLHKHWADPSGCTLAELFRACFFGVGAIFRRELYDDVGGFREDIFSEDYMFWLTALARGHRHRYLAAPLSVHKMGHTQKSSDSVRMRKADAIIISEVMRGGSLSAAEMRAASRMLWRLRVMILLARVGIGIPR